MTRLSRAALLERSLQIVETEHQEIALLLAQLVSARSDETIRETLLALESILPRHFANEEAERGGFVHLAKDLDDGPEIVATVRGEHAGILRQLLGLSNALDAGATIDDGILHMEIGRFVKTMAAHQRMERDLMARLKVEGA